MKWIKEKFKSDRPLTPNEEEVLFPLAQKGNRAAIDRILRSNMRFVIQVAKNYSNDSLSQEELVDEGAIGLLNSINYYDPSRGVRFITYAVWWIKASITRAISEKGNLVRLPLNRQCLLKKAKKMCTGSADLGPEMKALDAVMSRPLSIHREISSCNVQSLEDVIGDTTGESTDYLVEQKLKGKFLDKILNKLPIKERAVIKDLNGIDLGYTRSVREESLLLNVSRERIRQLRDQALRRIRNMNHDGYLSAELN